MCCLWTFLSYSSLRCCLTCLLYRRLAASGRVCPPCAASGHVCHPAACAAAGVSVIFRRLRCLWTCISVLQHPCAAYGRVYSAADCAVSKCIYSTAAVEQRRPKEARAASELTCMKTAHHFIFLAFFQFLFLFLFRLVSLLFCFSFAPDVNVSLTICDKSKKNFFFV
jgi:hypothetical protein